MVEFGSPALVPVTTSFVFSFVFDLVRFAACIRVILECAIYFNAGIGSSTSSLREFLTIAFSFAGVSL